MNSISVMFLCSEAFSSKLAVAVASLLDNKKKGTYYDIYVLLEKKYGDAAMRPFRLIEQNYQGFAIHWMEMGDAFATTITNSGGVGKETMYRLMAAEVLPGVDKCIYLDSDTMVLDDLSEMYEFDVENSYISGIYPKHFLSSMIKNYQEAYGALAMKQLENVMGLCSFDQYVGCGVMVMNLKLIREHGITEKLVASAAPGSVPRDQDILNRCCYGHIAKLPVKFCLDLHELNDLGWYVDHEPDDLPDIQNALIHPVVIHYADRFKPWKTLGMRYEDKWWEYASMLGVFVPNWKELKANLKIAESHPGGPVVAQAPPTGTPMTYEEFSKSISYRIGRAITFLPRVIRNAFRRVFK